MLQLHRFYGPKLPSRGFGQPLQSACGRIVQDKSARRVPAGINPAGKKGPQNTCIKILNRCIVFGH
jgi:hypothetical protein